MKNLLLIMLFLVLPTFTGFAQSSQLCLTDIVAWEDQLYAKSYQAETPPTALRYSIQTIDWENTSTKSEVKIYRDKNHLHFFSDQADIYQDEDNLFLVLHQKKTVLLGESSPDLFNSGFDENFLAMRKAFLDDCTITQCELEAGGKGIKIVTLQAPATTDQPLYINRIQYRFDTIGKRLVSTLIDYRKGYKAKQIQIQYLDLELSSNYDFGTAAWTHVLAAGGRPLPKFQNYQFIDNR